MNPSAFRSGFVNHIVIGALLGLGLTGSVGLGTVWLQHQISLEARRDEDLERTLDAVTRSSEELTTEIAREQDPDVLKQRNADWKLGLVPPAASQVRLESVDAVDYLMAESNRDLFRIPAGAGFQARAD